MDEVQSAERKQRRAFSDEYKRDTVRRITDEQYTFKAAAEALGVGEQSLRQWHANLAPKPEPCGEDATLDELREENKRLRRERRCETEYSRLFGDPTQDQSTFWEIWGQSTVT